MLSLINLIICIKYIQGSKLCQEELVENSGRRICEKEILLRNFCEYGYPVSRSQQEELLIE